MESEAVKRGFLLLERRSLLKRSFESFRMKRQKRAPLSLFSLLSHNHFYNLTALNLVESRYIGFNSLFHIQYFFLCNCSCADQPKFLLRLLILLTAYHLLSPSSLQSVWPFVPTQSLMVFTSSPMRNRSLTRPLHLHALDFNS